VEAVVREDLPVTSRVDERERVDPVIAPKEAVVEYSVVAVKAVEEAVESTVLPDTVRADDEALERLV
jgi:hypothetical protein